MREKLIKKIKEQSPQYSDEQAIQIANFLISLSEVYYKVKSKSNPKNNAA